MRRNVVLHLDNDLGVPLRIHFLALLSAMGFPSTISRRAWRYQ
jgi:hypothetical protein